MLATPGLSRGAQQPRMCYVDTGGQLLMGKRRLPVGVVAAAIGAAGAIAAAALIVIPQLQAQQNERRAKWEAAAQFASDSLSAYHRQMQLAGEGFVQAYPSTRRGDAKRGLPVSESRRKLILSAHAGISVDCHRLGIELDKLFPLSNDVKWFDRLRGPYGEYKLFLNAVADADSMNEFELRLPGARQHLLTALAGIDKLSAEVECRRMNRNR